MMTEPISLWVSHEAISRFFEKGLSVPEVALISGHKDVRMLFIFFHMLYRYGSKKVFVFSYT